jgi:hypothetical protein
MIVPSPSAASWRIDRRTFLKHMGISGVGLLASGSIGSLLGSLSASRVAAATGPIDDLALALEFDMERIFRFVSEQIRYEPYAGVLRGAEGTLMARAGNAADQAVLLSALLNASGIGSRFAQGTIDGEIGAAVLASAVSDAGELGQRLIDAITGGGLGGRPFTPPETDAQELERLTGADEKIPAVVGWAEAQLWDMYSMLESSLAQAGIPIHNAFAELPALERDAHVWVQAAHGQTWLDLDPSLPGAVAGGTAGAPLATWDAIPDDMRHLVQISIIVESISGGTLHEETVLEVSEFADVLAAEPIGVLNIEREGLKALGGSISAELEGGTAYVPCVAVGRHVVVGSRPVRFGGVPADDPFAGTFAAPSGPSFEGDSTAEWVQLTVASPGREPHMVRRGIFDRIGPAARAQGGDLARLQPAKLVSLRAGAAPDFPPALTSHWLTLHTGTVGGEALAAELQNTDVPSTLVNATRCWHMLRQMSAALFAPDAGVALASDGPNVVAVTVEQVPGEAGSIGALPSLDIWRRSSVALPVADAALTASPGMLAGILPHLAERLLAGDAVRDPALPPRPSVGAIFEIARDQGVPIRVVHAAEEIAGLPFAADALARLGTSLGAGRVAVVPERPVRVGDAERVGWWLYDPVSGSTVDEMDDGRGSVGLEYADTEEIPIVGAPQMQFVGQCVTIIAAIATVVFIVSIAASAAAGAAAGTGNSPRAWLQRYLALAGGNAGGQVANAVWNSLEGCA